MPRFSAGVITVVVLIAAASCDKNSPTQPSQGSHGGLNLETPTLDRIASEGVVFEQASSVAPLTLPAHCSLFTGLFPPQHGVRDNVDAPLGNPYTTLAEITRAGGMRTAAFVGSAVVGARRELAQGFDTYSPGKGPPTAD